MYFQTKLVYNLRFVKWGRNSCQLINQGIWGRQIKAPSPQAPHKNLQEFLTFLWLLPLQLTLKCPLHLHSYIILLQIVPRQHLRHKNPLKIFIIYVLRNLCKSLIRIGCRLTSPTKPITYNKLPGVLKMMISSVDYVTRVVDLLFWHALHIILRT